MHGGEDSYKDTHADRNKIKVLVAGAFSGALGRTAVSPLYRTTVLFQVQNMKTIGVPDYYRRGVIPAIVGMFKQEGMDGLFRGNFTHLVKKVPFSAIKFLSYERYKQILTPLGREDAGVWRRFISGGAAAVTAVVITYPLDLVQTQLTVQTTTKRYTGMVNTIATMTKEEGFLSLYRGLTVTLLSACPYTALNMTIWEVLKKVVTGDNKASAWVSALCGAASSAIASSVIFPLDVLRRHMQLNRDEYTGYGDAVRKIFARDGMKGFYRGIMPHFYTVIPAASISLASYDLAQRIFQVN